MSGIFSFACVIAAARGTALAAVAVLAAEAGLVMLAPSGAQAQDFRGEMVLSATAFCRSGTVYARGALLSIPQNFALFSLFGIRYGGDGVMTFAVPDFPENAETPFKTRMAWCAAVEGVLPTHGDPGGARIDGRLSGEIMATGAGFCPTGWELETAASLPLQSKITWCRALESAYSDNELMLAQMMLFSGDACPAYTLPADGRILQAPTNRALFSLLGAHFEGGDGTTHFALPAMASPAPGLRWCIVTQGIFPAPG